MRAAILDQRITAVSYGWEGARNASPSMQRVNGTVVRRNLANRPAGTSNVLNPGELGFIPRMAGSGGSQAISLLTDIQGPAGTGITTAVRKTWTVIGTTLNDVAFSHSISGVNAYPVTPGDVFTISSYWRVNRSQIAMLRSILNCQFINSSGADAGLVSGSNYTGPIVADEWNRVSITVTVPEGVAFVIPWLLISFKDKTSLQVGDTLDGTGLLVEKSPILRPYFDGDTQVNAATINGVTPL